MILKHCKILLSFCEFFPRYICISLAFYSSVFPGANSKLKLHLNIINTDIKLLADIIES